MKQLIKLTFLILLFANTSFAQKIEITGKIIDRNLKPMFAAQIENLNTKEIVISDKTGNYMISGNLGDTLKYSFVGSTDEIRKVESNVINVILIDKTLNCLGAVWSKRKWKREQKKVDKYYKKLYEIANRENRWETAR